MEELKGNRSARDEYKIYGEMVGWKMIKLKLSVQT